MSSLRNIPEGWRWWLGWVVVNTLSFAVGIGLSQAVASITGEITSLAIFGALVGLAQWSILRKHLSLTGWWVLVGALSAPVGLFILNLVERALLWSEYSLVLGFVSFGLVIGATQALILQNHFHKVGFWVLANSIGWSLAGLAIVLLTFRFPDFLKVIADYSLIGIITSISTGLILVIKFKNTALVEDSKPFRFRSLLPLVGILALIPISLFWTQTAIGHVDLTEIPDLYPNPTCPVPPRLECSDDQDFCNTLVPFEPIEGSGYVNYPFNGETWDNQYRSYIRQDLKMLIQNATARVACETNNWNYLAFGPIALIDMSEEDGAIPGTSVGNPNHSPGTHVDGKDIDLAYFHVERPSQLGRLEDGVFGIEGNLSRAVCKYTIFGIDIYHCTQSPQLLDPWRTALFIAFISQHPQIRVIGVDGQIGLVLETALDQLVQAGWIDPGLRAQIPLAFEETNEGMGWYRYHHHHLHISLLSE